MAKYLGEERPDGTQHDRGLRPLGGGSGRRRAGAAVVSQSRFQAGAIDAWRDQARERLRACLLQPDTGGVPEGPGPASARLRRAARRAPELAAPLRAADRGRLSQARRRAGPAARRARAARPRRQQVFRLAQDRPDQRPAPPDDEGAPRRLLRRRELGQRAGQARIRGPGPRRVRLRQPARPGRRPAGGHPQGARRKSTPSRRTRSRPTTSSPPTTRT